MKEVVEAFKRCEEALRISEKTVDIDLPTSASRLYIAGENLAACMLLLIEGSASRDHGKLWNGIQRLFEKGDLKKNYRPVLETSYRLRIKGDYGRDIEGVVLISREAIEEQIKCLKEFSEEVRQKMKTEGHVV